LLLHLIKAGVIFFGLRLEGDMQKAQAPGICPNCEGRRGQVGEPCPEPICQRKGYCFIPENWYQSANEFSKQRRKPFDSLLGRNLDRYLLIGRLGEGGMGAVYLALQGPLNREVALKLISGLDATQATISRFEREAQAVSLLDHPNIVKLHDFGVASFSGDDGFQVPYMALEYVKHGRTLRRAFAQMREERQGAPIPGDIVLSIFSQILNALGAAHVCDGEPLFRKGLGLWACKGGWGTGRGSKEPYGL